ncbi:MAG: glycosyltransferase family 4 protein [Gammaproteobacteria bacterium]|nr:glycosyltransferase family 4 protein [Gammaproteobacteria bacterium]
MRIVYHHRTQGEEPESIHILSIINALKSRGHDVLLVGPTKKDMSKAGSASGLLSRIKKHSPDWLFEFLQIVYNLVVYRRLRKAVKEYRPDFIYERYALYNFAGVLLSKLHGIPLILEVNTPYAYAWSRYYKIYLKKLAQRIEHWILKSAAHMITVTKAQKKFLVDTGQNPDKIVVCQNAIDPKEFNSGIAASSIVKKSPGSLVVGFVGTMNRWQGIPTFKEVIPAVLKHHKQVIFLLIGDGEFRKELEDSIRSAGLMDNVVFAGRRAHREVPSLVRLFDIAVLPDSNSYGSPMKIFEYMAVGAAVVAPRVGPVEEVLRDGETGLIVEPSHAAQMVDAITKLVEDRDLRERLSRKGREYVMSNHTWAKNAEIIETIYNQITTQA